MTRYRIRRQVTEEIELDPVELATIGDAARALGTTTQAVRSLIDSGRLTEYVDVDEANPQKSQRVAWVEVRQYAESKVARGETRRRGLELFVRALYESGGQDLRRGAWVGRDLGEGIVITPHWLTQWMRELVRLGIIADRGIFSSGHLVPKTVDDALKILHK